MKIKNENFLKSEKRSVTIMKELKRSTLLGEPTL